MSSWKHAFSCCLAGSVSGLLAGSIAAAATAKTTDSVQTPTQAIVLALLLGVCFAVGFAAVSLVFWTILEFLARRSKAEGRDHRPSAIQLGVAVFLLWGGLVGGLWLHDMILDAPLPGLLFRPLLILATGALAWFASKAVGRSQGLRQVAAIAAPLAIAAIIGTMAFSRIETPEEVEAPQSQRDAKVLLIALDGADWKRIDKVAAKGYLPNLTSLMERGYKAPLETIRPTLSPIIWTTVMSGTEEYDHGIHRFTSTSLPGMQCGLQGVDRSRRLPPKLGLGKLSELAYTLGLIELRPISGCHRRKMNLWNILNGAGLRSAIVNWYVSWPADPIDGYLVSDHNPARAQFYSKDLTTRVGGYTGITHPEELLGELASLPLPPLEARPSETLSLPFFQDLSEEQIREIRSAEWMLPMFRTIHMSDVFSSMSFLHLLDKEQPDFAAFYMSGIDNVSHRWSRAYPPMVDRYYEWVDGVLGQVLDKVSEDTTVIVVSDHGWDYEYEDRYHHGWGPDGVFLAAGPAIEPQQWTENSGTPKPTIFDVTPTLLSLFGLPAALDMPGQGIDLGIPNLGLLDRIATYGRYHSPALPDPSTNSAGADETMEKLKALGYLD